MPNKKDNLTKAMRKRMPKGECPRCKGIAPISADGLILTHKRRGRDFYCGFVNKLPTWNISTTER